MVRKDIKIETLQKMRDFLKKQKEPIFITDIMKKTGINLDSIKFALKIIKHKVNKENKIYVRRR